MNTVKIHVTFGEIHYFLQEVLFAGYQVNCLHPDFENVNKELEGKYFETSDDAKDFMRNKIADYWDKISFWK